MKRLMTWLRRDQRGAAAVELALVLPFIAWATLLAVNIWDVGMRKQNLSGALRASSQYYINGGNDDALAVAVGLAAWLEKPTDSSLVAARYCLCGTVAEVCTNLCPTGLPPAAFVKLTATATDPDATMYPTQTAERTVRVQ